MPCDLADRDALAALPEQTAEALGAPAILVHCGGITRDGLALRMKDEDWQEVLEVNLSAGFVLARACLRGMIRQRWGRLIFITSVVGTTGNAGQANYAASKAGLAGMVKALAAEAAVRGVTANCVAPGFIETAMTDALADAQKEALLSTIPAGALRRGQRCRRRLRLPRERGGPLRHRADAPRQRRHGHDLKRGRAPTGTRSSKPAFLTKVMVCAALSGRQGRKAVQRDVGHRANSLTHTVGRRAPPFGSRSGARPRRRGPRPYSLIRFSARSWRIERLGATQAVTVVRSAG